MWLTGVGFYSGKQADRMMHASRQVQHAFPTTATAAQNHCQDGAGSAITTLYIHVHKKYPVLN